MTRTTKGTKEHEENRQRFPLCAFVPFVVLDCCCGSRLLCRCKCAWIEDGLDRIYLPTAAWLCDGMDGESAAAAAAKCGVDVTPLNRYSQGALARERLQLGFAALDIREIRRGARELTRALTTA